MHIPPVAGGPRGLGLQNIKGDGFPIFRVISIVARTFCFEGWMLKESSLGLNVDQVVLNNGSCPISFFFWAWAPNVLDFQNEPSTHPKCM